MVNNTGNGPLLFKGKNINTRNHYYSKQKAYYASILKKDPIQACMTRNMDIIVIGHNKNWKQNIELGSINNQNFVQVPFTILIHMILYKAENVGIKIVIQEESYTSKASALDNDEIPVYTNGGE